MPLSLDTDDKLVYTQEETVDTKQGYVKLEGKKRKKKKKIYY